MEGTSVYLKLKDGKVVPTMLQNLSEEDRVYVRELTYKPREVTVTFRQNGYESVGEEVGTSPAATLRDIVVVQLSVAREGQKSEATGDSRWKIESVDVLGSRITARKQGGRRGIHPCGHGGGWR